VRAAGQQGFGFLREACVVATDLVAVMQDILKLPKALAINPGFGYTFAVIPLLIRKLVSAHTITTAAAASRPPAGQSNDLGPTVR